MMRLGPTLFDATESERLKDAGMNRAASRKTKDLWRAREIARKIALSSADRTCNADDVQRVLVAEGIDLKNAAGSIFRGSEWKFTGMMIKSVRAHAHSNLLRVWRFVGGAA